MKGLCCHTYTDSAFAMNLTSTTTTINDLNLTVEDASFRFQQGPDLDSITRCGHVLSRLPVRRIKTRTTTTLP